MEFYEKDDLPDDDIRLTDIKAKIGLDDEEFERQLAEAQANQEEDYEKNKKNTFTELIAKRRAELEYRELLKKLGDDVPF
jgi:predicted DsbA family dithiol-disulfide isomerase